eukprot:CAMPEP_0185036576 /NCGR_PEP_ID=MMETSP1103-20130426/29731_1 /TAXON_ID=36769 /ORGANISM="Paraphysomonas bandaiensis, Strain Caron Lab Isolate" /LENGTH=500 /DNA_ID=CAMNT_0027574151 /DNA_START=248 /DNA_END=1750 /DNA_ORIENTATION=+
MTHTIPMEVVIGLYDQYRREFVKYDTHKLKLGRQYLIKLELEHNESIQMLKMVVTTDLYNTPTVSEHTWGPLKRRTGYEDPVEAYTDTDASKDISEDTIEDTIEDIKLRVMTYNIWHNNPPSWLVHDKNKRWEWYSSRLRHLAEVILKEDPDIITLQEVRLDNTFVSSKDAAANSSSHRYTVPSGSQMHHLLLALDQLQSGSEADSSEAVVCEMDGVECVQRSERTDLSVKDVVNKYQFVFQPAMSMYDRSRMGQRIEEGVALMVKSPTLLQKMGGKNSIDESQRPWLTIKSSKTLFLPRDYDDKSDDHHRALLHGQIEVHGAHKHHPTIDVMTTHLSLSEMGRRRSVHAIGNHSQFDCSGDVQVLTGDFNAEADEYSYEFLTDTRKDVEESDISCGYVDAWVNSSAERHTSEGFTYPSCQPEKRIDFILVRNSTTAADRSVKWKAVVESSHIAGQATTLDTAHRVGSREGLGMLDMDSPIWASDHYAVVADLRLTVDSQ